MRKNLGLLVFGLSLALIVTHAMAGTLTIPPQTFSGSQTYGPVSVTAGQHDSSFAMSGAGDWTTGTPGRTITLQLQRSLDGGATWLNYAGTTFTSPNLDKRGNLPSMQVGSSPDSPACQYQLNATYSAPVTTGWTVTFQ